ncbi:hypothetical protein ACQB6R_05950 [Propionibacteriaceae bacterium G1746]|uniref:hypothetical protein n=1 Tax=Aestuariimicrobium sp. G57 TaxID=3418485 RepID=UPI003C1BA3F0
MTSSLLMPGPTALPLSPAAKELWRLHHQAVVLGAGRPDAVAIRVGQARWKLEGLRPATTGWLGSLGRWPTRCRAVAAGVGPSDEDAAQQAALARWLLREGLATRLDTGRTLLVSHGYSQLRPGVGRHLDLDYGTLPQPDDLALHRGLVVVEGALHDPAATQLLHRCGVPHVVVELGAERCRVGAFVDAGACVHCDDLALAAQRPLLASRLLLGEQRHLVPGWMVDWASNQVVLAARAWRQGAPLTPGWWTLDASGQVGHDVVLPHRSCCGSGAVRQAA